MTRSTGGPAPHDVGGRGAHDFVGRRPGAYDSVGAMAEDAPVFVISVAAELAGMHAQTLRQYDRLGLVSPGRTQGGGRRYSPRDVALLREVQRLSQEDGVNLAGIKRIIDLESRVEALQTRVHELLAELDRSEHRRMAAEAAVPPGFRRDLVPLQAPSSALVVWRPRTER